MIEETTDKAAHKQMEHPRGTVAEWTVTIILLLFGTTTLVQAFVIPTGSMKETLLIGDHLLVDKLSYAPAGPISKHLLPYDPIKRGDIIVFRYPMDIRQTFVKRCIGVPGDRIRIENKEVYVNGRKLHEPYKRVRPDTFFDSYRDNFPNEPNVRVEEPALRMLRNNVVNGELVVPPNNYLALGDNRDESLDSRYWGFVPRENIIGKPLIIYWSYDAPTENLQNSITLDHLLDLAQNFFTKTRWERTFRLVRGYPLQ